MRFILDVVAFKGTQDSAKSFCFKLQTIIPSYPIISQPTNWGRYLVQQMDDNKLTEWSLPGKKYRKRKGEAEEQKNTTEEKNWGGKHRETRQKRVNIDITQGEL